MQIYFPIHFYTTLYLIFLGGKIYFFSCPFKVDLFPIIKCIETLIRYMTMLFFNSLTEQASLLEL